MNVLLLYRRGQILTREKLNVFHFYITLFPAKLGLIIVPKNSLKSHLSLKKLPLILVRNNQVLKKQIPTILNLWSSDHIDKC